jgi:hypothetical protein
MALRRRDRRFVDRRRRALPPTVMRSPVPRSFAFALLATSVGCGAKIEAETVRIDSGPDAYAVTDSTEIVDVAVSKREGGTVADTGLWTGIGCPSAQPIDHSVCSSTIPGGTFYCLYFLGGSDCATSWKCSDWLGPPTRFGGGEEDCTIRSAVCTEGAPCGSMGPADGSCFVECTKVCRCDAASGTLKCEKLEC